MGVDYFIDQYFDPFEGVLTALHINVSGLAVRICVGRYLDVQRLGLLLDVLDCLAALAQDHADAVVGHGHYVSVGIRNVEIVVVDFHAIEVARGNVILIVLDFCNDPKLLVTNNGPGLIVGKYDLLDLVGRAGDLLGSVARNQDVQRLEIIGRRRLSFLLRTLLADLFLARESCSRSPLQVVFGWRL